MSLIVDLFNDSLEDSIEKFYKIFNITEELMILYSATFGNANEFYSFLKNKININIDKSTTFIFAHLTTIKTELLEKQGLVSLKKQLKDDNYPIATILKKYNVKINFDEGIIETNDYEIELKNYPNDLTKIMPLKEFVIKEKGSICAFLLSTNIYKYNNKIQKVPEILSKLSIIPDLKDLESEWDIYYASPKIVYFMCKLFDVREQERLLQQYCEIIYKFYKNKVKPSWHYTVCINKEVIETNQISCIDER